jgi:hypothetical protein
MTSYYFDNSPIATNLPVFNASIYRDIDNRGAMGFQGADGVGVQGIIGVQGVQGVQGLASPISVNNFVSGIQGLQSSFLYGGFQTARTQLLRADTIQTDTITNSGTTFKFNASNTANFDGQGIYMSMTGGSIPNLWLRSSTAPNKIVAFGDNTGSIPSASIQNWTASSDLRFYTGGNNEMCRMGSASNTQFFYPLIGTNSTFTNNYGVGFQGTQGSFGFLGCDSLNTSSITLPSSFVNTYTPTISASNFTTVSNTGFYTTMSAVKTAYGSIKVQWVSWTTTSGITQGSFIFTLPMSFFSNIHSLQVCVSATPGWGIQWASANSFSTSSVEISIFTNNGSPSGLQPTLSWYAIGN